MFRATIFLSLLWIKFNYACEADVVFLVDHSGSINEWDSYMYVQGDITNWGLILDFVIHIGMGFDIAPDKTRIAAAGFGSIASMFFDFNQVSSREELEDSVYNTFKYGGGFTNLTGGLRLVRTELLTEEAGDRADVHNIIILLTDGEPNIERDFLVHEATRLKLTNNTIIAIGVTDHVDLETLKAEVVSWPASRHLFYVAEFYELSIILGSVIAEACYDKPVSTKPTVCTDVDVMVAVDGSGLFTHINFDHVRDFIDALVQSADDHLKFALATFSDHVEMEWRFGQEQKDVSELCYLQGSVNSTELHRYLLDEAFNTSRPGAQKVVLVITDENIDTGAITDNLTQAGIEMVVVPIGCGVDHVTGQEIIRVRDYKDLLAIAHTVWERLCRG